MSSRPELRRRHWWVKEEGIFGFADDTSIATDVKVPIPKAFHQHVYDCDWKFSCGTKEYKVLMDEFHHMSQLLSRSLKEEPALETIEGEYWRVVEKATEEIEVHN